MREIKFRAWDRKEGQMYFPNKIGEAYGDRTIMIADFIDRQDYENNIIRNVSDKKDGAILMQFTGLKDKNGKEIYEGDIVVVYNKKEESFGELMTKGFIKYLDSYGAFKLMVKNGKRLNDFSLIQYDFRKDSWLKREEYNLIEVIGNIYENPELLGERC